MPILRIDADQYPWIQIHDDSSPLYTVAHVVTLDEMIEQWENA